MVGSGKHSLFKIRRQHHGIKKMLMIPESNTADGTNTQYPLLESPYNALCDEADTSPGTRKNIQPLTRHSKTALFICVVVLTTLLVFSLGRFSAQSESSPDTEVTSHPPALALTSLANVVGPACGPSWREAEAAGCVYDVVMSLWVARECHDADLLATYLSDARNRTFFTSQAAATTAAAAAAAAQDQDPDDPGLETAAGDSEVAPWEVVQSGRHDAALWTDGGFHHLHCTYVWDVQQRAYARAAQAATSAAGAGAGAAGVNSNSKLVLNSHCRDRKHTSHCIFWNGHPQGWEIVQPNVTRIYPPETPVSCVVGP